MTKPNYDAPALRNAITLIEVLADSELPMGVSDICKATGINSNMAFRLLKTLERAHWVIQVADGPKYTLGLQLFHHAAKPVRRMTLRKAAQVPMSELWESTGESCYLGIIDGTRTFFLDHLDSRQDVRITAQPGSRFFMHCAAPGKVLLAFSDEAFVDRVVKTEGLPPQTIHTITSPAKLKAELARIRKQGYALDVEEYSPGLFCCAAPIFNADGNLAGTIGLSVLAIHFSLNDVTSKLGPKVLTAAANISARLGHFPQKSNQ